MVANTALPDGAPLVPAPSSAASMTLLSKAVSSAGAAPPVGRQHATTETFEASLLRWVEICHQSGDPKDHQGILSFLAGIVPQTLVSRALDFLPAGGPADSYIIMQAASGEYSPAKRVTADLLGERQLAAVIALFRLSVLSLPAPIISPDEPIALGLTALSSPDLFPNGQFDRKVIARLVEVMLETADALPTRSPSRAFLMDRLLRRISSLESLAPAASPGSYALKDPNCCALLEGILGAFSCGPSHIVPLPAFTSFLSHVSQLVSGLEQGVMLDTASRLEQEPSADGTLLDESDHQQACAAAAAAAARPFTDIIHRVVVHYLQGRVATCPTPVLASSLAECESSSTASVATLSSPSVAEGPLAVGGGSEDTPAGDHDAVLLDFVTNELDFCLLRANEIVGLADESLAGEVAFLYRTLSSSLTSLSLLAMLRDDIVSPDDCIGYCTSILQGMVPSGTVAGLGPQVFATRACSSALFLLATKYPEHGDTILKILESALFDPLPLFAMLTPESELYRLLATTLVGDFVQVLLLSCATGPRPGPARGASATGATSASGLPLSMSSYSVSSIPLAGLALNSSAAATGAGAAAAGLTDTELRLRDMITSISSAMFGTSRATAPDALATGPSDTLLHHLSELNAIRALGALALAIPSMPLLVHHIMVSLQQHFNSSSALPHSLLERGIPSDSVYSSISRELSRMAVLVGAEQPVAGTGVTIRHQVVAFFAGLLSEDTDPSVDKVRRAVVVDAVAYMTRLSGRLAYLQRCETRAALLVALLRVFIERGIRATQATLRNDSETLAKLAAIVRLMGSIVQADFRCPATGAVVPYTILQPAGTSEGASTTTASAMGGGSPSPVGDGVELLFRQFWFLATQLGFTARLPSDSALRSAFVYVAHATPALFRAGGLQAFDAGLQADPSLVRFSWPAVKPEVRGLLVNYLPVGDLRALGHVQQLFIYTVALVERLRPVLSVRALLGLAAAAPRFAAPLDTTLDRLSEALFARALGQARRLRTPDTVLAGEAQRLLAASVDLDPLMAVAARRFLDQILLLNTHLHANSLLIDTLGALILATYRASQLSISGSMAGLLVPAAVPGAGSLLRVALSTNPVELARTGDYLRGDLATRWLGRLYTESPEAFRALFVAYANKSSPSSVRLLTGPDFAGLEAVVVPWFDVPGPEYAVRMATHFAALDQRQLVPEPDDLASMALCHNALAASRLTRLLCEQSTYAGELRSKLISGSVGALPASADISSATLAGEPGTGAPPAARRLTRSLLASLRLLVAQLEQSAPCDVISPGAALADRSAISQDPGMAGLVSPAGIRSIILRAAAYLVLSGTGAGEALAHAPGDAAAALAAAAASPRPTSAAASESAIPFDLSGEAISILRILGRLPFISGRADLAAHVAEACVDAWWWLIVSRPELETALLSNIVLGWSQAVRARTGLFATAALVDPVYGKIDYQPPGEYQPVQPHLLATASQTAVLRFLLSYTSSRMHKSPVHAELLMHFLRETFNATLSTLPEARLGRFLAAHIALSLIGSGIFYGQPAEVRVLHLSVVHSLLTWFAGRPCWSPGHIGRQLQELATMAEVLRLLTALPPATSPTAGTVAAALARYAGEEPHRLLMHLVALEIDRLLIWLSAGSYPAPASGGLLRSGTGSGASTSASTPVGTDFSTLPMGEGSLGALVDEDDATADMMGPGAGVTGTGIPAQLPSLASAAALSDVPALSAPGWHQALGNSRVVGVMEAVRAVLGAAFPARHTLTNREYWRAATDIAWSLDPGLALRLVERVPPAGEVISPALERLVAADPIEAQHYPAAVWYLLTPENLERSVPALRFLPSWAAVPPMSALALFLPKYRAHPLVLQYAVRVLDETPAAHMLFYTPQIVQALRYDQSGHIANYIRSIARDPRGQLLAHQFIWNMKANMYIDAEGEQPDALKPVLDELLQQVVSSFSREDSAYYEREFSFFAQVTGISGSLRPYIRKSKREKKAKIDEELGKILDVPAGAYLPSTPESKVLGIDYTSGRPLQSHAKAPFMATFRVEKPGATGSASANGESVWQSVIFKVGDDCRQDVLALQMIALFQRVFSQVGLDMYTYPYRVVATDAGCGVIEVVPNTISRDMLGRENVNSLMTYFLNAFGPEHGQAFQKARANFARSMAAYSVIVYLLTLRDRHNGNIMLDSAGHIIHIDFGFVLGISPGGVVFNDILKSGFETSPFLLKREMIEVLGGVDSPTYLWFTELVVQGYLALRPYMQEVIHLVRLMQGSNLPCFPHGGDEVFKRLRYRFQPELSERGAAQFMRMCIAKSIENYRTTAYDMFQKLQNGIPY
ncbi:phosphatidylinositol 4-kinase [Fonticula alba]|uniref:1-phosphatidylinositol 4-kinase n=1 Tax=Fonticula alba TaxID=691883 RepID=A0A058ZGA3_FONAL|nr:phosphatidylinositol 4-kinase [Fonticula alba]KCV72966.1 phosphatidylinositol 4-kinase [Fonticula alba]|eukprot:XP_009492667.1 phosphatidylinositol 4-kinase [Fonticula alba]